MPWKITFDPAKRERTLRERKLDFLDAPLVFDGETYDIPDTRHDYGEFRINTIGYLNGRMLIICWTPRGDARHIISMRKTNGREKNRYGKALAAYRKRTEEG
ncbi:MAG: BrnT family toxin [Pseudolabrys sp.]|nr:BrnT family toxin [Pseudolabrys sp.]